MTDKADYVWLGDLAGFQVSAFDGGLALTHRCGASWPLDAAGHYLANLIADKLLPHCSDGCLNGDGADPSKDPPRAPTHVK